jgi:hypothetical protein
VERRRRRPRGHERHPRRAGGTGENAIGTSEFDLEGIARYSNVRRLGVSTSEEIERP